MKNIVVVLVMLFMTACGSSGGGGGGGPVPAASGINGTFRACVPSLSGDFGDTLITFSEPNFSSTTVYYSSPGCTGTNLGTENSTGTFVVGSGNQLDYTYTGGSTVYDIYELNGNLLRLGDRSGGEGSSPSNRPTSYDSSFTFVRQ